VIVSDVPPASNAYKAGLRAGDRIVKLCNARVDYNTTQYIKQILKQRLRIDMEVEKVMEFVVWPKFVEDFSRYNLCAVVSRCPPKLTH